MVQAADNTLEGRLAALERQVVAIRAAAAVGGTTVAATADAAVTLTGVISTAGSVPWNTAAGPSVDLFVSGGRIRVDVAATLEASGNRASVYAGYRVLGPADDAGSLGAAPERVAPAYATSAQLQDDGVGMSLIGSGTAFDVVTDLEPGWYRVVECYALTYSGTTGAAPYGTASYRRLAVTRY